MNGQKDIYITEYYSAVKQNEILPFTTIWMDLENMVLNEVSQQRKTNIIYQQQYVDSLKKKNDVNESFYKTETDSQIQKANLLLPKGKSGIWKGEGLGVWN